MGQRRWQSICWENNRFYCISFYIMKIVIIHGTFWHPEENRFPWLKKELELLWHEVYIPKLPTPENQTPSHRCESLQKQVPFIFDKDTILVWHSLWATYLLHILDRERKEPVKKAIFVSWFVHLLWNETFDMLNQSFLYDHFNREKIRSNTTKSIVFHWEDDPYVPVTEAEYLSKHLWAKLIFIPQGGHLNTDAWYTKFPELLAEIVDN
jgi:predicted alpha/beta hydrolase family esterase